MHKNATKCNEIIGKWCKNKHGASKIIDTFETYQAFITIYPSSPTWHHRLVKHKQKIEDDERFFVLLFDQFLGNIN
jgi:hypothetical protein